MGWGGMVTCAQFWPPSMIVGALLKRPAPLMTHSSEQHAKLRKATVWLELNFLLFTLAPMYGCICLGQRGQDKHTKEAQQVLKQPRKPYQLAAKQWMRALIHQCTLR